MEIHMIYLCLNTHIQTSALLLLPRLKWNIKHSPISFFNAAHTTVDFISLLQ